MAHQFITRKEFEALCRIPTDQRTAAQQARIDLWFEIGESLSPEDYI